MESFLVSARKYRPDTFDTVVGQSHITNTLRNALKTGQLAHAFLFSGPRGVGKTTCARILAKSINCKTPTPEGDACNDCDSCRSFNDGRSMNIHELDAASNNSVEDIRKIIEQVRYIPAGGGKSVFIIDEVHMLSQAAFNAFLKTLEEPPSHAIFILATTEKHKILPTILSRCQKFDFRRIKVDDIADHLKRICDREKIQYEFEGLQLIALKADGALRDGLSIFDQIVSFSNRNVTYAIVLENLNVLDYDYFFKTVDLMMDQDHAEMLLLLNKIIDLGFDPKDYISGLVEHMRNLLIVRTPKTMGLLETSDNVKKQYADQCGKVPPTLLLNAFQLVNDVDMKLRNSNNPRLLVELMMMKLAYLKSAIQVAEIAAEEKKKSLAERVSRPSTPSVSGEVPEASVPGLNLGEGKKRRSKSFASTFSIPKSLEDVKIETPDDAADDAASEEDRMAYDTNVNIDEEKFFAIYDDIVNRLYDEGRKALGTSLQKQGVKLDHNKWIQSVPADHMKRLLDMEKDILSEIRERLGVPNLILEVIVNPLARPEDARPFTVQEKFDAMLKKNPDLQEFMRRFDAMLDY